MNTNERNTDARGQVNPEGFKPQQSADVQTQTLIPMSGTAADLQAIRAFLGMSTNSLQTLWNLCRGENRAFYRQQVASLADITRTMRNHRRTF